MIVITIDRNMNRVHLDKVEKVDNQEDKHDITWEHVEELDKVLSIVDELLNLLDSKTPIRLEVIDEDIVSIIGEW